MSAYVLSVATAADLPRAAMHAGNDRPDRITHVAVAHGSVTAVGLD